MIAPTGLMMTYEAIADLDGSINRTAAGKANFWNHLQASCGAEGFVDMEEFGKAQRGWLQGMLALPSGILIQGPRDDARPE